MCKEQPVILVNKVVDPKRLIGKKWRAEEEERHKGSLTQKKRQQCNVHTYVCKDILSIVYLGGDSNRGFPCLEADR
jgi:hypothetical protein